MRNLSHSYKNQVKRAACTFPFSWAKSKIVSKVLAVKSSFTQYTGIDVRFKIADIGASVLTDNYRPPYRELLDCGAADIIGFEPSPVFLTELNKMKGPYETYLPHALGDSKNTRSMFARRQA